MSAARALDVLQRAGVKLGRTSSGEVLAVGLPAALEPLVERYRAELVFAVAVAGARTGHRLRVCDTCHREALTAKAGGRCRMTPRCKGKARDLADPPALVLDGEPLPCARPGCRRPAAHLTAQLELVCTSDLAHLALHLDREAQP